ncbi:carbohydrate ABC transporter permease [Paenibacillus sp. NEAU-GSW1]|uniref:carbohydrate ABC transporter permease n=1 Tax=Paenibacillus sp. NEAU-GSW1 TaxID=2682486 RepID=UPI0012E25C2C|nr:carbohydrate ABC transporter permease [Paenibacillus sp. NEAU-GSW1]MUT65166.1 ABC transporter permease subunit [Paenibacillus sp. NEAU-GSW1]
MERYENPVVTVLKYASLIVASIVVLFPIYSVFVGAFKTREEFYSSGLSLPDNFFNFDNFVRVIEIGRLDIGFMNILTILAVALCGNILFGSMVAFAIGRFDFKLKNGIIGLFLLGQLIPTITTQVALFSVVKSLMLYNKLAVAMVLYMGADVLQIIIYLQFVRSIPKDLDESAMMEGASLFRIYRSIIFPLLAPATATLVILKTISIYNDFTVPFLFMQDERLQVVSTAIAAFVGPNAAQLNLISAAVLLIFIPTIVIFLVLQKYIFSGVTSGAVK